MAPMGSSSGGVPHVEPAVGLDVVHEVELVGLLVGERPAHLDAGRVQQEVDAVGGLPDPVEHPRHGRGVGEVDGVVAHGPAGFPDGVDRGQCGSQPLEPEQLLLDRHRGRPGPVLLHPRGKDRLEPLPVLHVLPQIGIGRIRLRGEVEEMEGAARGTGQIRGDRGDDAAGRTGDDHDAVRVEGGGSILLGTLRREGTLGEAHAPAPPVGPADLDASGVSQRLLDEQLRHGRGLGVDRQVDRLDQRVGALALVGLGEPGDRPTHGGGGTGVVVAVEATQAGARDQERVVVVQPAHGGVERLHPPSQSFLPSREVERLRRVPRRRARAASRRRRSCPRSATRR